MRGAGTQIARGGRVVAVLTAVALVSSGCGVLSGGLRGVDLPGGADLGDHPYAVTAEFADVAELVPQSLVKVNDVPVGTVTGIRLGPDWTAMVTMLVNGDVALPANALARVRTTSLLGEKFVELAAPPDATGRLTDGAVIPLARSSRAAEVEEVLGSLSLLLNGGGLAQVRTIARELNAALSGNEPQIRELLDDVDALVSALDDRKTEITRALDEINRLSATLADRRGQIEVALADLAPGLRELEAQRARLVDMLQALDRLSGVATDVVNRSRDDVIADLELLRPVLRKLVESGDDLPNSLEFLLTPPFTDAAVEGFAGDYANLYINFDLDLRSVLDNLLRSNQPFPGPDGLRLPPTSQLLGPLLGPTTPSAPGFPLLGDDDGAAEPSPTPAPEEKRSGGLLGNLLGGGR